MNTQERNHGSAHAVFVRLVLLAVGVLAMIFPGAAISIPPAPAPASSPHTHMSEALRSSFKKLVVLPSRGPAEQAVIGSYAKPTAGLIDGARAGSEIGRGVSTEVGGIPIAIPIPILTLPGALIGGLSGGAKRKVQDFRDALTADLAAAASQPLSNEALATDVFWGLRNLPGLDAKIFLLTTPIPSDTDAILYVSLSNVVIDVQGKEAIITTSAHATLRRLSDGANVYEKEVQYQDTDTLSNWTRNENMAWRNYATFARHYIGREISAEVFERVQLKHELRPQQTDTVTRVRKNAWQGVSRSSTPTLAWQLTLLGGDSYGSWATLISAADISYDVEIYDQHRLVYSAKRVQEPRHTVSVDLEKCKSYRWSVRPSYSIGSDTRFGEWMRFNSDTVTGNGNVGRRASDAPAYIQDFALLKIKC